jgi:hypothetical protein
LPFAVVALEYQPDCQRQHYDCGIDPGLRPPVILPQERHPRRQIEDRERHGGQDDQQDVDQYVWSVRGNKIFSPESIPLGQDNDG